MFILFNSMIFFVHHIRKKNKKKEKYTETDKENIKEYSIRQMIKKMMQ